MGTIEIEPIKILMADDDEDDLELFISALKETELNTRLKAVGDGWQSGYYFSRYKYALPGRQTMSAGNKEK